jgi:molecular chaperone GrpE
MSPLEDETMSEASENVAEAEAASQPTDDGASLEALQKDLEAARAQAAEYLDGWQRARAEFANYKRRVEKEQAEAYQHAAARIIARYLDVLDDFERALKDQPTEGEAAAWAEGIALIFRKLQNTLDAEGVARIEAEGQPFDPALHEAVTHEDSDDHDAGHIIEVLRQGYRLGERVIRPALVRVAK